MTSHAQTLDNPVLVPFGLPEYVKGTSPAAGALFSEATPGGEARRLVTVFARIVTDANIADRTVYLEYLDPEGNRILIAGGPVTQSASSTNDYAWQAFLGQSDWAVDSTVLVTLPPVLLLPQFSWRINIANVQVGDQISRVRYVRERFYIGSPLALAPPS